MLLVIASSSSSLAIAAPFLNAIQTIWNLLNTSPTLHPLPLSLLFLLGDTKTRETRRDVAKDRFLGARRRRGERAREGMKTNETRVETTVRKGAKRENAKECKGRGRDGDHLNRRLSIIL